jgi:hypothetical protein
MEKLSDKYKAGDSGQDKPQSSFGQNNYAPSYPKFPTNKAPYIDTSERETLIKMMVGETGVGKTVHIIKECLAYVQDNPITGKKARPVFILHPNVLFEPQYMNTFKNHIRLHQIKEVSAPQVYIILPINPDGSIMNDSEKRNAIIFATNNCQKCLLVLDDIDDVFKGAKPRDMDKLFVSYRHRSIDLITTHQFLNPITTQEWGAVTTISLRKTVQSVSIIADRVPNPEILYISEMMVAEQYNLAETKYREGEISKEEWYHRRSFFVDVNIRTNRIIGAYSRDCFIRNCKKYLNLNSRKISDFQKIYCDAEGKPVYNREQSIQRIISKELWRYYAGRE